MNIKIDRKIFDLAPDFRRSVVVGTGINNRGEPPELVRILRSAIADLQQSRRPQESDSVVRWDEIHRDFGSNPNKYPPAHKNLAKRLRKPGASLPLINPVVGIMNATSIRLNTPVGGDDIESAAKFGCALELRLADGSETFVPLGKDQAEQHPEPGEVIYAVGSVVACRKFNWRNSAQTLITPETTQLVMNIDAVGPSASLIAEKGAEVVASLLEEHCSAQVTTARISAELSEIEIGAMAVSS